MKKSAFTSMKKKVFHGEGIGREEAFNLIGHDDFMELFFLADQARKNVFGNKVSLCGIINAKSGRCSEDCRFCAQSGYYHTGVKEYALLSPRDIIDRGKNVFKQGAQGFSIVTSGKKAPEGEDLEKICHAIAELKGYGYLCSSLGLLREDQAKILKKAGLKRYHHNLETSREFFPRICSTHSFQERVETIKNAQKAGLEVCSGGIFGLGESWEDRINLAFELKKLKVHSIPLNFLNPIPGTPMENRALLSSLECLKIIAIYRLINPLANITVCGGREVNLRDLQSWIFFAGANGMMIGNYLTTRGREISDDLTMVKDLGLTIG